MEHDILIADDHPLFREALSTIVASVCKGSAIHHAQNHDEVHEALEKQPFKLAFLDLNMPGFNGLTDLAVFKKAFPSTPLVVVSAHEDPELIRTCLSHQVSGYIIKSCSSDEMKRAINQVLDGQVYSPPSIDLTLPTEDSAASDAAKKIASLTPSQLKVLIEIGKGKLNKQIAYDLEISEGTVKAHVTSIFRKLNITSRTQAVLLTQQYQSKLGTLVNKDNPQT